MAPLDLYGRNMGTSRRQCLAAWSAGGEGGVDGHRARVEGEEMVDRTTNSYAHHRPIPPWTARTARRDIARGRTYSRLGRGPGGVTDLHAARPTRGAHHCREVPRKDDTTATFSLRLERAKWAEIFFRLMHGILNMGLAVEFWRAVQYTPRGPY